MRSEDMKRFFAVLLVCVLLLSSAFADAWRYQLSYNFWAEDYGAPTITDSMLTEETDQRITFTCNDTRIMFGAVNSTEINSAAVEGPDSADFLPICVCAALTVGASTDNFTASLGVLLYAYMEVKSGRDSSARFFGDMMLTLKKTENGLFFAVGK